MCPGSPSLPLTLTSHGAEPTTEARAKLSEQSVSHSPYSGPSMGRQKVLFHTIKSTCTAHSSPFRVLGESLPPLSSAEIPGWVGGRVLPAPQILSAHAPLTWNPKPTHCLCRSRGTPCSSQYGKMQPYLEGVRGTSCQLSHGHALCSVTCGVRVPSPMAKRSGVPLSGLLGALD